MARRWEAAHSVIAVCVALLIGVFGAFGYLVWQADANSFSQAQERAQRGADLVARQTAWIVGSSISTLELVAERIEGNPDAIEGSALIALQEALRALPGDGEFAVYDAAGREASAFQSDRVPESIGETGFFQSLADGADWAVSRQMQHPVDGTSVFAVGRRLESEGQFSGVAVLAFSGGLLRRTWEPLDLGEQSTVSVLREDGWLVARFPALDGEFDASGSEAFQVASTGEQRGTIDRVLVSPADGVARVLGYYRLPQYGLIVYSTVSQASIQKSIRSATLTVLFLMGPIALALLIGAFWVAWLLHQSARTQERLAAALESNELLFREIHHRVKNNLQSVASLFQLQPIPREIKQEMGQRIAAMSAVHEHIYRSNSFDTVRVRDYLRKLIETIQAGQDERVTLVADIEDLPVDKDTAMPLGLIVNEVVANAFKHAFPEQRKGEVRVTLERTPEGMGMLTVADNGVGFDAEVKSKGIGRRLVTALTEQIGGSATLSGERGGRFVLTFPLAAA